LIASLMAFDCVPHQLVRSDSHSGESLMAYDGLPDGH
jgi:hypothetical protein